MRNVFLITVTFMLVLAALSFAQDEQMTLTALMPPPPWILHDSTNSLYTGDSTGTWKVGINTITPDGKLDVEGEVAGEPALVLSNTWKNDNENPDQNSPFVLRKDASNDESFMTFVQDKITHFHYRNDDDRGVIMFRIQNTDTESGGGTNANDNRIMVVQSTTSGGNVAIGPRTYADAPLEVYESNTTGTVYISYGWVGSGITIRNFQSSGDWVKGFNIEDSDGTPFVQFGAYGTGHTLNYAYIGNAYDNETVRFYPMTKVTTFQGNVGIGTETPGAYQLNVNGDVYVDGDITRTGSCGADYVFEEDYELMRLAELKKFIKQNKHLPGMPSAKEIKENGVKLFEETRLILEKLEEAYLYVIDLEKRIAKLEE